MQKLLIHYLMKTTRACILVFGILVVFSSLLSARNGYSQEPDIKEIYLSVNAHHTPLKTVFKEIKQHTGLGFFYNASSVNVNQPIELQAENKSLWYVLSVVSEQANLEFKLINKHISVRPRTIVDKDYQLPPIQRAAMKIPELIDSDHSLYYRRDTAVTGKVTDENNIALPGVTVQVAGTQKGTITDEYGRFTLDVPLLDTLVFSFVGYERTRITYRGKSSMLVKLTPSAAGLNEVVVVGYGTQRKQDVTSSVSQVTGEDIRKTPTASLQNALTGKVTGFFAQQRSGQPGGSSAASIHIRGLSSFVGNQAPLVLVDNVEYNYEQLFLIDPNVIESVSILKDAAATAIYGIKGANGVILVTTRRGEVGKPVIRLTTQWGTQIPTYRLKTLNAYQSALLQNEALKNDGESPMFSPTDLYLFKTGKDPYGHPDVNWNDVLFKKSSLVTNNNIDISGGGKRVQYFLSLGYMWQNGDLKDVPYKGKSPEMTHSDDINNNYYMKRYKFRSNLDIKATKSLHFQLDLVGTHEETNSPEVTGPLGRMYRYYYLTPFMYPVYNPDGSFGYANPNRLVPANEENNIAGLVALGGYQRSENDFMDVHITGKQDMGAIVPGLSLKAEVAFSYANTAERDLYRSQGFLSYWFNPVDSTYHPRNETVSRISPYKLTYKGGTPNRRLNLQGAVDYQRSFGSHNVSGLVLFNQTSYYEGSDPPVNFRGYTFRLTYNYKHKYLFGASGAYNGSSRFVTQKRYSLFPAISAGYNIAKESFFKSALPFIESFKIRGSYGWVGSDDIGGNQYLYESVYERSGNYAFGESANVVQGIVERQQGNYDVTWQTERKADLGIDFSLFKGSLSGGVDYFDNYRYDILTTRQTVPLFFGVRAADLPPVNIGKVGNRGVEVELHYRTNIGAVGIDIKGTYSYAKNRILFQDEPPVKYPWQKGTGLSIGMQKQYIWTGTFYMDQKDIDTSASPAGTIKPGYLKYKDLNGDGIVDLDDMAYTGYPNLPNTNIGLTLGLHYKGLRFSVLLQSALHFSVYSGFDMAVPFRTVLQPMHLDRWTPETAETATFPLMTTLFNGTYMSPRGNPSTFWSVNGDYLRIRSAYLSYQLPVQLVDRVGLSAAQVFLNGYNLFTWSDVLKRYQFDPESEPGSDSYVYPVQRIFNFGLRLTFK